MDEVCAVKHVETMGNSITGLDDFALDFPVWVELWLVGTLFAMMFAVALALVPGSFGFFRRSPRIYLAGLFSQLLALPAITLLLCYLLQPSPTLALGMIIVACCPGGASSNLVALYARGNIGLSVALTATSSILAAFLTPISTVFWSRLYGPTAEIMRALDLDVVAFLVQTALILGVPIAAGMALCRFAPDWSLKWRGRVGLAAGLSLLGVIVVTTVMYFDAFWALGLGVPLLVWIHNFSALGTGYGIGKAVRADDASVRSLTIETGIQNTGLALVIIVTQFTGLGGAVAVVGLYGTYHLISGLGIAWLWRRRKLPEPAPA